LLAVYFMIGGFSRFVIVEGGDDERPCRISFDARGP